MMSFLIGRRIAGNLVKQRNSRIFLSTTSATLQQEKAQTKILDDKADIAIIGGGIVGTSLAYHLAKQSNKKVSTYPNK